MKILFFVRRIEKRESQVESLLPPQANHGQGPVGARGSMGMGAPPGGPDALESDKVTESTGKSLARGIDNTP